jgi:hypothetical protein
MNTSSVEFSLQTMNESLLVHTFEGEVIHIFVALICECTIIYRNLFIMYFVSGCTSAIRLHSGCFGNLIMLHHLI